MSIDRTLKIKSSLVRHRSVLTRGERVAKLQEENRWSDDMGALGLPKVGNRKLMAGKKKAKGPDKGEEE